MKSVPRLLDAIKKQHAISSDYKLSLYLGLREQSIANYRHGRTLPDAAACAKIAAALALDADLLTVEIEAQRAKTDDARKLWERVAQRLQMGFANCALLAVLAIVSIAASALPAWSAIGLTSISANSLYIMLNDVARKTIPYLCQNQLNLLTNPVEPATSAVTNAPAQRQQAPALPCR